MRLMTVRLMMSVAIAGMLLLGADQVRADTIFNGLFYDQGGDAGTFSLVAQHDSGAQWTAISGTLTVTSGLNVGSYDLYSIGDNPSSVVYSSSTGNFGFDNNIFPTLDPVLSTSGLLFVNNGSGASGVAEVSFFGLPSPPAQGHYAYYSSSLAFGEYNVTNDNVTFIIVPEPSAMAIWIVLFGMTAVAGLWKRNPVAVPIVA